MSVVKLGMPPIHGHASGGKRSPTWYSWKAARDRCSRPKNASYKNYGARGISMCPTWTKSFISFLKDMGERPPETSLDRINTDGNYEPGNCRWATAKQQHNNTKRNRFLTFNGKTLTLAQWGECLGLCDNLLYMRLAAGWSIEKTLSTPHRSKNKRSRICKEPLQ